jgi:hypothetical protein
MESRLLRTSLELKDFVAISFSLPLLAVGSKGIFEFGAGAPK